MIELVLPAPPLVLRGNRIWGGRTHWSKRTDAVKAYKEVVYYTVRSQLGASLEGWTHAVQQTTWVHPNKRDIMDGDNSLTSLKVTFDGLVASGVLADDNHLIHLPCTNEVVKGQPATVHVKLIPGELDIAKLWTAIERGEFAWASKS